MKRHAILFSGHMIDRKEREKARFPASKEPVVKMAILRQLMEETTKTDKLLTGIAGGACGGDILFHELCQQIGIYSEIFLSHPTEEYKKRSVSFAGPEWENRFNKIIKKSPVYILPDMKFKSQKNTIWVLTNLWMLDQAIEIEEGSITLIALWDGKRGTGDGGTEHMINESRAKGAEIKIININKV